MPSDPPEGEAAGPIPTAEPEYPTDSPTKWPGYVAVSGVYRAPKKATTAVVELHLLDAPKGSVTWSDVSLEPCDPPPARKVRLAAVHYTPKGGKSSLDTPCKVYEPFIAEAAKQKADLVVLGETITYVGMGRDFTKVAEAVPGPSTDYFGTLAKKHNSYIVAGLVERDGHLLYNVAALIGPDGELVGKYRKVCLPRDEVEGGITAGKDYPVFDTRFGKLGMMVCYDGFFPEVARELTNRGAEVIAFPVAGCNPLLVATRACENHTYVVSSTYTDRAAKWARAATDLRPRRRDACRGRKVGHGSRRRGRFVEAALLAEQPRRLPQRDSTRTARTRKVINQAGGQHESQRLRQDRERRDRDGTQRAARDEQAKKRSRTRKGFKLGWAIAEIRCSPRFTGTIKIARSRRSATSISRMSISPRRRSAGTRSSSRTTRSCSRRKTSMRWQSPHPTTGTRSCAWKPAPQARMCIAKSPCRCASRRAERW